MRRSEIDSSSGPRWTEVELAERWRHYKRLWARRAQVRAKALSLWAGRNSVRLKAEGLQSADLELGASATAILVYEAQDASVRN